LVNASLNWASIVGIALAIVGGGLFFIRALKPEIARGYDVLVGAIGLLCGGILFFQGWRLDPILQFGQFLLAGTLVFIAYENFQLRKRLYKLTGHKKINNINESNTASEWVDPSDKQSRYYRDIGIYKKNDLKEMEDTKVYEIIKLHLKGISKGEIKPEKGEVEYLKNILNTLNKE